MRRVLLLGVLAVSVLFGAFGVAPLLAEEEGDGVTVVDLIAGQHYVAGEVVITDGNGFVTVDVYPVNGWSIGDTHLYVGCEEPTKAAPGKFPYKYESSYVVDVDCEGDSIYIAFHAEVVGPDGAETAWAEGDLDFGKGWSMYLVYEPGEPEDPPEES